MRPGIRELEAELRFGCWPDSIVKSYKPDCGRPDDPCPFNQVVSKALKLRC